MFKLDALQFEDGPITITVPGQPGLQIDEWIVSDGTLEGAIRDAETE